MFIYKAEIPKMFGSIKDFVKGCTYCLIIETSDNDVKYFKLESNSKNGKHCRYFCEINCNDIDLIKFRKLLTVAKFLTREIELMLGSVEFIMAKKGILTSSPEYVKCNCCGEIYDKYQEEININ
jgi:hypothetical protein